MTVETLSSPDGSEDDLFIPAGHPGFWTSLRACFSKLLLILSAI